MNIIFDDQLANVSDSHTLLELDTFRSPDETKRKTVYGLIEQVPLAEFPILEQLKKCHSDMMDAYKSQNWEYCRSAIAGLTGRFNGEMDSFYKDLQQRIDHYETNPPGDTWDGSRSSIDFK